MSNPINETRLTGQNATKPRQPNPTTDSAVGRSNGRQGAELADDRISLSGTAAKDAAEARISTLAAARQAIEKLKQQIDANPDAVLSAQRGINTDQVTTTLGQVAA